MPAAASLAPLYRRLKTVGFDRLFLQRAVLPDWWEDSLAANATTRSQFELHIAQRLGVPLAQLRDPAQPITLPGTDDVRLKRATGGAKRGDIAPGGKGSVESCCKIPAIRRWNAVAARHACHASMAARIGCPPAFHPY